MIELRPIPQAREYLHGSRGELFEHISVFDPFQMFSPFHAKGTKYWSKGFDDTQLTARTSTYRRGSAFVSWLIRSEYMQSREFGSSSDMWLEDADHC